MTRPINILIAMVTLGVGYFLLNIKLPIHSFILQALGFALAIGFGNIQNDVLDFESDKRNRPNRPLPSGAITLKAAKTAWIVMLVLCILSGLVDSLLLGLSCENKPGISTFVPTIFFIALALLLIAYNKKLKHIPLLKNMTVAFLCATPLFLNFLYAISIIDGSTNSIFSRLGILYPAMMFAFLLTTTREIYKDLEDETGDLVAGIMTFPLIAGSTTARRFASALAIFCWALLPLPVLQEFYSIWFLIIAATVVTPTLLIAIVSAQKKNYHRAQGFVKVAMFLGLIALILSTIL